MTLHQGSLKLEIAQQNFQWVDHFQLKIFQFLADGVFQIESYISCRIRSNKGTIFYPIYHIVQNYNDHSLQFFLTLWFVLDK